MPVEYFLRYRGQCYDVGTKLRFKTSKASWARVVEGTIELITHHDVIIRLTDGSSWELCKIWSLDDVIIEIITPVYYTEPVKTYKNNRVCPPMGDIDIGWAWYIIIMLVGTIFNDRILIWIVATVYFFLWKNGFFNGGKK